MSPPIPGVDALAAEIAARITTWLRQTWPRHTAKQAAAALGVSVETARGWLAGQMPANRHMVALTARFGAAFIAHVYAPFPWARDYDLIARLEELSHGLAALRAALDAPLPGARADLALRAVHGRGGAPARTADEPEVTE
jgi:hypothetical protein